MKRLFFIFVLILNLGHLQAEEVIETKESILKHIDSFSDEDFHIAYMTVTNFLKEEDNGKAVKILSNWSNYGYFKTHYKDMLKTIANNESDFTHKIGLYDKNDISYFQINIASHLWNIKKLRNFTKLNIDKKILLDNVKVAGFVALHILIYNSAIYVNYNNANSFNKYSVKELIATYNNPIKLNSIYIEKADNFLTSL